MSIGNSVKNMGGRQHIKISEKPEIKDYIKNT